MFQYIKVGDFMYCKKCGHELSCQDKYCSECGTKVEKEEMNLSLSDAIDEAIDKQDIKKKQETETLEEALIEDSEIDDITEKKEWYFVENNESKGPFSESQMHDFLESGRIQETSYVWKDGFSDWKALNQTDLFSKEINEEVDEKDASWYYVDLDSNQHGPYTEEEMKDFFHQNKINRNTFVWTEGMEDWQALKETELKEETTFVQEEQENFNRPYFTGIQHRNIPLYVLLCFVTCGLFALYWLYSIANDVNHCLERHGQKAGLQAGFVVLLTVVTCGIYGIYFWYKVGTELSSIQFNDGYKAADNTIICLVLAILGLSIISMCIVQDQLNGITSHE